MKHQSLVFGPLLALGAFACKTGGPASFAKDTATLGEDAGVCPDPLGPCAHDVGPTTAGGGGDAAEGASPLSLPPGGGRDNDLDETRVLEALRQIKAEFHTTDTADPDKMLVEANEVKTCLQNLVPWWSDLMLHYFCQLPSYQIPFRDDENMRQCFSTLSRQMPYNDAYDICVYAPNFTEFNKFASDKPKTMAELDFQKPVGRMRWVYKNQDAAFRYIMFSSVFTFRLDQQQDVLNQYYGVKLSKSSYTAADAAEVAECRAKRPLRMLDPTDGTHCSLTKAMPGLAPKP